VSVKRPIAEALAAIEAVMRESGLRWYLFGAQAAIVWGSPRLSVDVDVTVTIEPEELEPFIDAMQARGFRLESREFLGHRVLPFVRRENKLPLDVVIAGPGLEDEFLARAVPVDIAGTPIPVISPEDLIVTKILAGRPKDIEDVRGVLADRFESLDLDRVRSLLRLLEQALGQSDLLSTLERQIERL
jgi:predicted nucleotidyltransferase